MTRSHADEIDEVLATRGLSPGALAADREMRVRLAAEAELLAALRGADVRATQDCIAHARARVRWYEAEAVREDAIAWNRRPRNAMGSDHGRQWRYGHDPHRPRLSSGAEP